VENLRHRITTAVLAVVTAAGLLIIVAPAVSAATDLSTNCGVNLRDAPSTTGTSLAIIPIGTTVTTTSTVAGDPWTGSCPSSLSGTNWYAISAVNGTSVASLYGVDVVYAATGLFTTGSYLEGIDVSHYQKTINWPAVAAAGKKFAVIQATVGSTYLDPTYVANRDGARSVSLPITAYHYAAPLSNPGDAVAQADWFVQNAALRPGDLVPALDLEKNGGLSTSALQAWVSDWLTEVTSRLGVRPMIYTSPDFWKNSMGDTTEFADAGYNVLWVAHWNTLSPRTPANNWEGAGWTIWQYTDCGSVAGISGCVDLDRYNGIDLTRLTIGSIQNPNGGGTQPAPVLSGISPASGRAGDGDITITIDGANFTPSSRAYWNGTPLNTTFVSANQLTAVVPAALTSLPGSGAVTVANPSGLPSGPVTFAIAIGNVQLQLVPSTSVVTWGQAAMMNATTQHLGPGQPVAIQRMQVNEADWSTVTTATTDANGGTVLQVTPPVNTQYRVAYTGADGTQVTSAPVRIVVRQTIVLRPTNAGRVKSARLNSSTTFTATVRPVEPTLAPARVTFQFWWLQGRTWVNVGNRHVATDAAGRASTTWRFNASGQWYVRAIADPTVTNANSVITPIERYSVT
jgi:lysozyme